MCATCGRHIVRVDVRLGETTVTMHSCSTCDTRWWELDGRPVGLDIILGLASADT